MNTMEFEEMKKVWDTQNDQPLYAFSEKALQNHILARKKQAGHITRLSELLTIVVYAGTGSFVILLNQIKQTGNLPMYLLGGWMLGSAVLMLLARVGRLKGADRFDRTLHGDLEQAISTATYQVKISRLLRWNMLPVALLTILGMWYSGTPGWLLAGMLLFFLLAAYASGWEHNIYTSKKRSLEALQHQLENIDQPSPTGD